MSQLPSTGRNARATPVLAALALSIVAGIAKADPAPAARLDYNFHVRPLLADRCFRCHGPDQRARKAGLRLDTPEGAFAPLRDPGKRAIVRGEAAKSTLFLRISSADADFRMPPPESNLSLAPDEIEVIRRWIEEGAEYKPHWAFLPLPEAVPLPEVAGRDWPWPRSPLDRFVLARLEREGLAPSPPAPREDWIRRASFDLTGLPPAPEAVAAFLADDSPGAFERAADRLLASPRFGERLALEWLDVARYADSFGYQADGDTQVWPWRDWVIDAFNRNLPFDEFITWQLAGDLLPNPAREQRLATAFNRLHRMTNEGGSIPEEFRNEYVSDRVQTFGTVFLALTVECCRCHDHKYDPVKMKDYYGLGAFFNSIDEWGTYDNSHFRPTPSMLLPTAAEEEALERLSGEVEAAVASLREVETSRQAAFESWLAGAAPSSNAAGATRLQPELPGLFGHYLLDKLEPENRIENLVDAKNPGSVSAANKLVAGKIGSALQFTGDDPAVFPNVAGSLDRFEEYTVSFWIWTPEVMNRGIVFHRQGGTDTGFHGTELSFDEGRLLFALVRFWPGNAIAVCTRAKLPARAWTQVTVSYDASGRASGLRIYLDGAPAEVEVLRDNLYKNLDAGGSGLTFGERFRSSGLKGGLIDDVRVYKRPLSPIEAAQLFDGKALAEAMARKDAVALRPYYLSAIDPEAAKAREELRQARKRFFDAQNGVFEVMVMAEMPEPRPAYVLRRGEYDAPRDTPAGRVTPAALPPFPAGAPLNRLGLARWLTGPRHPLTARVAVNRYWQMLYGRGIVATTENFGLQGALPSHPELLDWLARDFMASGWNVKALLRTIVLSSTYRQRSATSRELRERDPENVLLARGPSRRLPAEMLRDAALAAGGLLVPRIGGPPAKPYQPPGLWRGQNAFLPEYVADQGEGLYRRSLYTFWRRTSPPPNMTAFDAPSREVCIVRRQSTSTPLQPLVLLNDPQFVEAARALAERMLREGGATLEERLAFAFRLAATRRPAARELELLGELYRGQLQGFEKEPESARKYVSIGSRPPGAGLDAVELAAATAAASAILNLDAAVMTR